MNLSTRSAFLTLVAMAACGRQTPAPAAESEFTIAVLPDTQGYSQYHPEIFMAQTRWLAQNRERLNLKLVVHVGDLVEGSWLTEQWKVARHAMSLLDGEVPYIIAPGNHDYGEDFRGRNARDRTTRLHRYFQPTVFRTMPTFGGFFPEEGRVDNSYHRFSAGGEDWLVIALEFGPRDAVVDWTKELIEKHPNHRVILATHAYLYSDSQRYDRVKRGKSQEWNPYIYGVGKIDVNDGEEIWLKALAGHKNVLAVLCGHVLNAGVGYAVTDGVHQLLANYQMNEKAGNGFLRLMTFNTRARTVKVRTYSPWLQKSDLRSEHHFEFRYQPL